MEVVTDTNKTVSDCAVSFYLDHFVPSRVSRNKAVSDGAIAFYLDHSVRSRVSKITYGVFCDVVYDRNRANHRERKSTGYISVSGEKLIRSEFDVILPKNTQIAETKEFRRSYNRTADSKYGLMGIASVTLWCYRGLIAEPTWMTVDPENYTKLCLIGFDLSSLPRRKYQKQGALAGTVFYRVDYDVVLLFGLTELKAHIAWKEGGIEKRTAAKIVYNPYDAT